MNLIRLAIDRPIAVVAAVLMVVLFGVLALTRIPIQLAPDVERPVISVRTSWAGAAPAEVEREIVNRQEDVLKGLEGVVEVRSSAETGRGRVTLEFEIGTNMDRAMLLVSNRLSEVSGYPDEVDEPRLDTSGTDDNPIAWFTLTRLPGNERPVYEYGDFVEDVIQDRLERVPGVASTNAFGESSREIQVTVDPQLLAHYRLTVSDVIDRIQEGNASISAGDVEEGKRRYVVRTEGELDTLEAVRRVVLRTDEDSDTGRIGRVTIGDVADVSFGYADRTARMRVLGQEAMGLSVIRETGANVMETMEGIREAVKELNAFAVPNAGLKLEQHYDETTYIESAIDLVNNNIYVGGSLAAVVLLLFLRSLGATLVVSLAIPVSIVGAFVAMAAFGRSINVISLAGLAFAIGMVVDAAIVVLENIFRLLEKGMPSREAAYRGAKEVWGAVLVSALTTVMVFVPILVMELEVGQLFRDIAVAISVAVMLSLLVSITVVPALARRLLGQRDERAASNSWTRIHLPIIDPLASAFVAGVMGFVRACTRSKALAISVVAMATVAAGAGAWMFLPKLEYLPEGNRNLVFGSIIPPPGYNLATTFDIAQSMEDQAKPYWASVSGPESQPGEPPKIQRFFFVATDNRTFLGVVASEEQRAGELVPLLQQSAFKEPGTFGFVSQPSIFGRGVGSGRRVDIDISGPDLETDLELTQRIMQKAMAVLPLAAGNQYRPNPGLELGAPEVRVLPDRLRLADNGVSVRDFAETIDVFNDGARAAEVTVDNNRLDLVLQGPDRNVSRTQGIGNLPVVTSSGQILPASSLSEVILTSGPTEIRHHERLRTITLEIRPAAGIPLESAIEILQTQVLDPLIAEGLPPGVSLGMSGTADKLSETWDAMVVQLMLAVVIVYLVMAVLFESWIYPLVIMLAVPLAAAGGVAGLAVLNIFVYQPLDMLTLLGFVILVGIVVNNAILVVHQMLFHIREEGFLPAAAILEATRNRIRPIFMSTLTSVVGMLPLVVFPGAGSELYRGLGSVVVGGLMLSAILTLVIIPPMLSLVTDLLEGKALRRQSRTPPIGDAAPQPAPGE